MKKHISIFVVPHGRGRQRTLSLSKRAIRILGSMALALVLCLTVFLVDYFTMDVTRQKYRALQDENLSQQEMLMKYKKAVARLNADIENYQSYASKLNVMAGLKNDEPLKGVEGVGNGAPIGQDLLPRITPKDVNLPQLENIEIKADLVEQNLAVLLAHYEADTLKLVSTPSIWPARGYVSSKYAYRDDPFTGKRTMHWGLDIATYPGNPVWATANGTVISTKFDRTGGNTVKISHGNGIVTVYCHLSKFKVKAGQKVKRGQVIGLVGKTGRARGPHVHYEVRVNGVRTDPYKYILED